MADEEEDEEYEEGEDDDEEEYDADYDDDDDDDDGEAPEVSNAILRGQRSPYISSARQMMVGILW